MLPLIIDEVYHKIYRYTLALVVTLVIIVIWSLIIKFIPFYHLIDTNIVVGSITGFTIEVCIME